MSQPLVASTPLCSLTPSTSLQTHQQWLEQAVQLARENRQQGGRPFAALLVRYFEEAGLEKGDTVAVGTSGSFPGLFIATLCAATEMELDTKVIASFGSSP